MANYSGQGYSNLFVINSLRATRISPSIRGDGHVEEVRWWLSRELAEKISSPSRTADIERSRSSKVWGHWRTQRTPNELSRMMQSFAA